MTGLVFILISRLGNCYLEAHLLAKLEAHLVAQSLTKIKWEM